MSTTAPPLVVQQIPLERIDCGGNVRDIDPDHVARLAGSMKLIGQLQPVTVRPADGERFALTAGEHRYAAAAQLGSPTIDAVVRTGDGASGDQAAENVMRKQLTPLEEARAVGKMLADGFTADGAAQVLGWSKRLVTSRARILELPAAAQALIGAGEIPVSAIDTLLAIQTVAPKLCELVGEVIAEQLENGNPLGAQFARDPGWVVSEALRARPGDVFAASLTGGVLHGDELAELKLGKKTTGLYAEACELHEQLDRYAYGPPRVRFAEGDVDQARAAGVLLELGRTQLVLDRGVYRELVKTAVARTVEELRSRKQAKAEEKTASRSPRRERTPREELDAEHRAQAREFAARAHGVNLDLGAALLDQVATVDPASIDVARFFALGLLGPESGSYLGTADHAARTIAANGIRLVLAEHRTTETPTLKSGEPGKTKVTYGDVDQAVKWLWRFVDGAKTAGELYGRTLVVFAAQHYASQLALPTSQRRGSVLPASRKDVARKAFEKIVKPALPASHRELARAIEREARDYHARVTELEHAARQATKDQPPAGDSDGEDLDSDPIDGEDLEDLEDAG